MAENTPKKSKRDQFGERLKAKYPDREYADDEALFGQIDEDYAKYDDQIVQYKERERKVTEMMRKDPRSAQFISDMANGTDPWIAVIERLGVDGVTDLMNDPSKQVEYVEANKKYVEHLAKAKQLDEEYQANFAESLKLLEQIQKEQGLSDETVDAAMDMVMKMVNDAIVGKFGRETIETALKAMSRESDINNARSEGEIAGRNAKIEEQLRKQKSGDGMPIMGGKNGTATQNKRNMNIFDYAEAAK